MGSFFRVFVWVDGLEASVVGAGGAVHSAAIDSKGTTHLQRQHTPLQGDARLQVSPMLHTGGAITWECGGTKTASVLLLLGWLSHREKLGTRLSCT